MSGTGTSLVRMKQGLTSVLTDFTASSGDFKNLVTVTSLREAFSRYGIHENDTITAWELTTIFDKVMEEKLKLYNKYLNDNDYQRAKEVRRLLDALKLECDAIQLQQRKMAQQHQKGTMAKAKEKLSRSVKRNSANLLKRTRATCQRREQSLSESHRAQLAEMNAALDRMPKPRMRYSKMMLEFKNSEKHLSRLERFDEASELRKQITLLEPSEVDNFEGAFEKKKEKLRKKLEGKHTFELRKMLEKNKDAEYQARRQEAQNQKIIERRLKNLEMDMNHSHVLDAIKNDGRRPPRHSAYYFGEQLLSVASGNTQHNVPSLCKLHDFDDELEGSHTV